MENALQYLHAILIAGANSRKECTWNLGDAVTAGGDGSLKNDWAEVQFCVLLAHVIGQNPNPHMAYKSDAVITAGH